MKSYEKKKETMRKIIVSQVETINQQNKKIKSLTNENLRLHAEYEKVDRVMTQFKKILDDIECQHIKDAKIRKRMKKMRKKLNTVNKVR